MVIMRAFLVCKGVHGLHGVPNTISCVRFGPKATKREKIQSYTFFVKGCESETFYESRESLRAIERDRTVLSRPWDAGRRCRTDFATGSATEASLCASQALHRRDH